MKSLFKILIFSLFAINSYAQQATEIDSKSVKLPRYANLAGIQAAIPTAFPGMMVYNIETGTNWYFNGSAWTDTSGSLALPFSQTRSSSLALFDVVNNGSGQAGRFEISNAANNLVVVSAKTNGTGDVFQGLHNGTAGRAGYFQISNLTNSSTALDATTFGVGKAGNFAISNASNSNYAFSASTNGSGHAGYFEGTNALKTSGTIKFGAPGVGSIAAGKVLTSDAVGNATWQDIPVAVAPLNLTSSNTTFRSIANGISGRAGEFEIDNPSNNLSALRSSTNGTGYAAYFQGTNALETSGTIKFGAPGMGSIAAGKVLTSDAVGNATWQALAPMSLFSASGTTLTTTSTSGTAANFSSASGFALVTGSGNVGIGAAAPTAKLEVAGFTKLGDDGTAPKIKMKELATFNTASGASGEPGLSLPQAHGLTVSKIISISVFVSVGAEILIPPVYSSDSRLNYNYFISGANFYIQNSSTDCSSLGGHICGKPVKVLITYKE